jgi:P-type E1-E2 ATPase
VIAPSKITEGGKIQQVCFDKTGTLTEIGMIFHAFYKKGELSKKLDISEI